MPSSTSSSEPRGSRRAFLRTALAGAGLWILAMGIIRGCTALTESLAPDPFGIVPIKTANRALPAIAAAPGSKAVFFGSSTVQFGFAPPVFDARLAESGIEITSYNLGIGNMNPSLQLVLARRLRDAFEGRGARIDLLRVEFNPFQATRKRVDANAPFREAVLSILSSPRELAAEALRDPERALRMFTIKYLRDGVAAESITTGLGMGFGFVASLLGYTGAPQERSPEYQQVLEEREELSGELFWRVSEEVDGWDLAGGWQLKTRGGIPLIEDFTPETGEMIVRLMANLAHPESLQQDLERRIRCCDIIDLHFDEGLVRAFIATLQELAPISDRIEVVLMPKNYEWVVNPPEALARQRAVLERIERETGVAVRDYQYLSTLPACYYLDVSHLTLHEGRVRFSALLADDWAPRY